MEQVIRWHERAILPSQDVNPCDLCFGMCPFGEEGARLRCDVGFLFFKWLVVSARPCLKTTLQRCLVGLLEPGDSSDFLAWLMPIDLFLNTLVPSLQVALWFGLSIFSYC